MILTTLIYKEILNQKNKNGDYYNEAIDNEVSKKLSETTPIYSSKNERGMIAYHRDGKQYRIKLNRYLGKHLKLNNYWKSHNVKKLSDALLERLWPSDLVIDVLSGKEITEAYRKAIGNHSCMTGSASEYTRLYEMNPDKIALLVAIKDNDLARCVLWRMDNNEFYADRIYSCSIIIANMLNSYIDDKGYERYGKTNSRLADVSKLKYHEGCIPYMDTFKFGTIDSKDDTLTVSVNDGEYTLESQQGMLGCFDYICESCGEHLCEGDEYVNSYGVIYCEYCYDDIHTCCNNCGDEILTEDSIMTGWNEVLCKYCYDELWTICDICDKMIRKSEDVYYCEDITQYETWCEDCYIEKVFKCALCDDEFLIEEDLCHWNNEKVCTQCLHKKQVNNIEMMAAKMKKEK